MQLPPRIPVLSSSADTRTAILQGLLIATLVIAALYVGREVLVPLALAILLSFVLTRPLVMLRRVGMPRILSVVIVVSCAFAIIFGLGWLVSREFTQLAADVPTYRAALSEKIKGLRESAPASPVLKRAGDVLTGLQKELSQGEPSAAPQADNGGKPPDGKPLQVEVRQPEPTVFELFRQIAGTVLPPLATAGIVLLFVIFILIQREDLRDRFIRLLGSSDLQRATTTLDDAATRLSKYFLRQLLINSGFGVLIAVALWAIGIPSPLVWGVLAMLMRFVPFVGSYIGAIPPLLLATVVDPGWSTFLIVLALYVVGEMTMGQVVEPLVFGHGTGVSPIAVLVSTVFWTWLWGPLGLLLAMPMTVCLAVLGRHVEDLHMFQVLLGDEPALTPDQCFYQRALSGDAAEATHQAELHIKEQSFESGLEEVVLGGLKLAERDARRGLLDAERAQRVSNTVKEMLENLADFAPRRWFAKNHQKENDDKATGLASLKAAEAGEDEGETGAIDRAELAPGWREDDAILCVGGRTPLDEAAAALLAEILKRRGLGAKAPATEATSAGHIASLAGTEAKLVCLCYLGLGTGPAHVRYLVKRLRRILPEGTAILVAYFPNGSGAGSVKEMLAAAEADSYAASLKEAADIAVATAKGEIKSKGPGEAAAQVSAAKSEIKSVKSSEAAAPVVSPEANRVLVPAAAKRKRAASSRGRGEVS
ncbi:MAG TPA: AI-2E family transporter [Methyloceanibacter sp.]|nr:AI-2E family transporter [Methyloceanibacter sp.]